MVAGWYDDPRDPHLLRWWDGRAWTDHTRARPSSAPPSFEAPTELRSSSAPTAGPSGGPFSPPSAFDDLLRSAPPPMGPAAARPGPTPVQRAPVAPGAASARAPRAGTAPPLRPSVAASPRLGVVPGTIGVTVCVLAGVIAFLVARAVVGG